MQFKYPELLYALGLLLIPIIVHLFQLRRFEKIAFTNVKFLKKVELQTRKSSKLKKFLILITRLLLFAALILAFAQPYFSQNKKNETVKTIIYLDNSLSMQAKNGTNELMKNAVQDIITNFNNDDVVSVLTNADSYQDLSSKDLKNQLLSLEYHPISQDLNTILLRAKKELSANKNTKNQVVLISDFQNNNDLSSLKLDSTLQYSFVQLLPQKKENVAIDSLYIDKQNGQEIVLKAVLKSYNATFNNFSVSLFKDNILTRKSTCEIKKNKSTVVTFKIPFNDSFNGKITIEDNLLAFDNTFYFSLNKLEKINVLAIGNDLNYLTKLFTNNEFRLQSKTLAQVDYNTISNQHLIVLNELESIPNSLQKVLKTFVNSGGSLAVIPAVKSDIANYNQFMNALKIGSITDIDNIEHKVNTINFSHPILDNVFEKQVKNFQYPNLKKTFRVQLRNASSILKFDNLRPFISQINSNKGNIYWLSGAINNTNSNFKNSPLIVPIFYNFGKQSCQLTELYYTIGQKNTIEIKTEIKKDEVLKIVDKTDSFIPLQNANQNTVKIITEEQPLKAQHYQIVKQEKTLKNAAYNFNRIESNTSYLDVKNQFKNYRNTRFSKNISETLDYIKNENTSTLLWKYCIALALLFLIIEMLLIKFLKG
jgi:hypothetical protein